MMSNARVTYESDSRHLAVTAFINNIEDELVFSNSLQSPAKPGDDLQPDPAAAHLRREGNGAVLTDIGGAPRPAFPTHSL